MARLPRLPQINDFPTSCRLSIIPPQNNNSSAVTNALILLHGLGDSEAPFKNLAESLALPDTVSISLRAPQIIPPFLTGSDAPAFYWSDDLLFDEQANSIDGDGGFVRTTGLLEEIITVLANRCGFKERDLWFLGFGQGAMAALGLVTKVERGGGAGRDEFGGVVAIGAGLPKETLTWIPATASDR
ncbi:putative hydrolase C9G1.08c [Erysiphe neolycopersici]|uniref:Putative hydrolase C9G1.08c n=1 Tax=Erysiphe neolycopersici TaxID=212602 RepID=A0A420I6R1_9PEZI|nr:putative hydrolase C9G1.08c [Erysiphe neolycopersici]